MYPGVRVLTIYNCQYQLSAGVWGCHLPIPGFYSLLGRAILVLSLSSVLSGDPDWCFLFGQIHNKVHSLRSSHFRERQSKEKEREKKRARAKESRGGRGREESSRYCKTNSLSLKKTNALKNETRPAHPQCKGFNLMVV